MEHADITSLKNFISNFETSRSLDLDYLTKFHEQGQQRIHFLEIAFEQEVRLHQQARVAQAELHRRLAEAEGSLKHVVLFLNLEKQRGDTYKRLYNEKWAQEEAKVAQFAKAHRFKPSLEALVEDEAKAPPPATSA